MMGEQIRLVDASKAQWELYKTAKFYKDCDERFAAGLIAAGGYVGCVEPTIDAVPVVRCKYCKNWDTDWLPTSSNGEYHYCVNLDHMTDADFFCKDGERRCDNAKID